MALYRRVEVLLSDLGWLRGRRYTAVELDAAEWDGDGRMHEALQSALSLPASYGRNLDATWTQPGRAQRLPVA